MTPAGGAWSCAQGRYERAFATVVASRLRAQLRWISAKSLFANFALLRRDRGRAGTGDRRLPPHTLVAGHVPACVASTCVPCRGSSRRCLRGPA